MSPHTFTNKEINWIPREFFARQTSFAHQNVRLARTSDSKRRFPKFLTPILKHIHMGV